LGLHAPSIFRLILIELNALGLIPFVPKDNYSTFGCEFYCSLVRGRVETSGLEQKRLELYKAVVMELAEQAEALKS
jgi:hypothetical protein